MSHSPTRRAIAYIRVSTEQQRDSGLGLDAQREAIAQAAARLQLAIVAIFTDAGVSGTRGIEHRPGLADALNAVRRGDVLIVAKRDRLARDVFLSTLIDRQMEQRGARIVSAAGEGTADDDPASVFTRRILDAVGELERALTAARTRAALRAKRARGERAGNEPYGFRVNGDGRTLHPDATEREIVRVIQQSRAAGLSFAATADALNRQHFRTRAGTPWRRQYVQSLLLTVAKHVTEAA